MTTGHIDHLLSEYIDGVLNKASADKVKSHLVFCNPCRKIHQELQKNVELLQSFPSQEPPAYLQEKILSRIKADSKGAPETQPAKSELAPWNWSTKGLALAFSCAIVIVLVKTLPRQISDINQTSQPSLANSEIPQRAQIKKVDFMAGGKGEAGKKQESMGSLESDLAPMRRSIVGGEETKGKNQEPAKEALPDKQPPWMPASIPLEKKSNFKSAEAPNLKDSSQPTLKFKAENIQVSPRLPNEIMATPRQAGGRTDQSPLIMASSKSTENELISRDNYQKVSKLDESNKPSVSESKILDQNWKLSGLDSGITQGQHSLVSTKKLWKTLWKNHSSNQNSPEPLPEIDFNNYDVIAIFAGTQSSGGYSLQIMEVEETEWEGNPARIVHYRLNSPPKDAMKTMALVYPYLIQTIPKISGPTFFRKRQ